MSTKTKTFTYSVELDRDGERTAQLRSGERPDIATGPPEDFGGDPSRWSPEHLFLASMQACTMLSFLAHADHAGVPVVAYTCEIEGTVMRRAEDGRYAFVYVRQRRGSPWPRRTGRMPARSSARPSATASSPLRPPRSCRSTGTSSRPDAARRRGGG